MSDYRRIGSRHLETLISELSRLPGIGRKTAQRLAFHILRAPENEALAFAQSIQQVRSQGGACRDCGICAAICPEGAIRKIEKEPPDYEYVVDENLCIGCGFCAGACPCGIWNLVENDPLDG